MNLLPPKKKLTHAHCFTPNMLPVIIYIYMVILTEDTDVLIICLSVFHQISDICMSNVEQKQTTAHWH